MPDINWPGQSNTSYSYFIHPIGTTFKHEPGNYIFAMETRPGFWTPIYIGQTDDLGERLANHEREGDAIRNGATHLHARINSGGEAARRAEESDLIAKWSPVVNGTSVTNVRTRR